jgi:hypothetical protein
LPRWYVWIAGVLVVRAIGENVSVTAALVLAPTLLVAYWLYRLGTVPQLGETRIRAARRELRRIGAELGDVAFGWLLIFLVLSAVIGVVVTWPPGWAFFAIVAVVVILGPILLVVSIFGVSNVSNRFRSRRWTARRDRLDDVLDAWDDHALSTEATDRAVVEEVVREVYRRKRGLTPPAIQWAGSPPEFIRLLDGAADRARLHKPPPSWFSLLPLGNEYFTWYAIWTLAAGTGEGEEERDDDEPAVPDAMGSELEAALASAAGVHGVERLVEQTAWFSFRTGVAVMLERPTEIHLQDDALHNAHGPVVRFPDGWAGWALEGVPVPREAVEDPDSYDVRGALTHPNVEVRRVLFTHFGWERVVGAARLMPDVQDENGRLWRLPGPEGEPLLLLEVENATLEADGTRRRYFLRVPPEMHSPREAIAWTFGLEEAEYAPQAES